MEGPIIGEARAVAHQNLQGFPSPSAEEGKHAASPLASLQRPSSGYASPHRQSSAGRVPTIQTNGLPVHGLLTPDGGRRESQLDPLSAHILQRTGTGFHGTPEESPHFKRNPSDQGHSKREESPTVLEVDPRERKKRVSFFAKLRGHHRTEDVVTDPEVLAREEGAQARTFCNCPKQAKPPYIRVRAHNKSKQDFNTVFLAQEMKPPTEEEGGAIWSMKFSPDGRYLAVGGQDRILRVWRVLASPADRHDNDTGNLKLNAPVFMQEPYREYAGHEGDILDLSWSKNNFLLSSSMDKTVRLWHVSREECLCCFQHTDFVTAIAFHPKDDRYFLSGSLDCKLRLWNITEKKVAYWNQLPELITAVAFSPEGRAAIAGSFNGLCLFYETEGLRYHTQVHVRSNRGKNKHGAKITGLETFLWKASDPSSEIKLLVTSNDSRIRLYNMRDKSLEMKFKGNANSASQIRAAISEDRRHVICGSEDRHVYIWDTRRSDNNEKKERLGYERFDAHNDIVSATCFAPQRAKELLGTSGDPIYDLVQRSRGRAATIGSTSSSLNGDRESIASQIAVGEGQILVTADYSGTIKVFRQDAAAAIRAHASANGTSNGNGSAGETFAQNRLLRRVSVLSTSTSRSTPTPVASEKISKAASVASEEGHSSVVRKPHETVAPASPARSSGGTRTTPSMADSSMPPPSTTRSSRASFFQRSEKHKQDEADRLEATRLAKHRSEPNLGKMSQAQDFLDATGVSYGYYDFDAQRDRPRRRDSVLSGASGGPLERTGTAQSTWTNGSTGDHEQGDLSTMTRTQSQDGAMSGNDTHYARPHSRHMGPALGVHPGQQEMVCLHCKGVTFTAVRSGTGFSLSCTVCFTVLET